MKERQGRCDNHQVSKDHFFCVSMEGVVISIGCRWVDFSYTEMFPHVFCELYK